MENGTFVVKKMHSHLMHLRPVFYQYTRGRMGVSLERRGHPVMVGGQTICGEFIP